MALQIFGQDGDIPQGHNYLRVSPQGALYIVAQDERYPALTGDIASLSAQVQANDADIAYLSGQIDHTAINANISFLSGAIDTNTTNIQANDADIAFISGQVLNMTSASGIVMARIGSSTWSTVQHMQDIFHSPGIVNGGSFVDNLDGTINVLSGSGLIRATDSSTALLYWTDWAATTNLALTNDDMNYIYVEWNGGSPQVVADTTKRTDIQSNLLLGSVYRSGTTIHPTEGTRPIVGDHALQMIQRLKATAPFARASGGLLTESGTRNISVTAGSWWEGLTNFTTAAFDSSGSDRFSAYYRAAPSGWTVQSSQAQINNTQYDNGTGTLATLTANRYGVHWIYVDTDGEIYSIFGRGDYTLADAEAANAPADTPPFFADSHSKLIGKIIVQKSASSFTEVLSVFDSTIDVSNPTDHGSLIGLNDDDHTQYILVNGSRAFTSTVSGITPVTQNDLTTKGYVDGLNTTALTQIAANDLDIVYLSGQIDLDKINITQNATDIDSLSAAIDAIPAPVDWSGDISYLSGAIDTNTTNVNQASTDILTLSGNFQYQDETVSFLTSDSAAQIQAKIDAIPKVAAPGTNPTVTFRFQDGTHTLTDSLTFYNFKYRITIAGNAADTGSSTTQAVTIDMTGGSNSTLLKIEQCSYVYIYGLKISTPNSAGNPVQFLNVPAAYIRGMYFNNAGTTVTSSIDADSLSTVYAVVNNFTNGNTAITSSVASRIYSNSNASTGTNPTFGLRANDGGLIIKNSTQPTGTSANETTASGGLIR